MPYPSNNQDDEILLMLDNSKITLDNLMRTVDEHLLKGKAYTQKRIRIYITKYAGSHLMKVGDSEQASVLREAIKEMRSLCSGREEETYWNGVGDYYIQKDKESQPEEPTTKDGAEYRGYEKVKF